MEGWVKLHRKLVDWEWYSDNPVKIVFIHLLLTANHAPKKWQGKEIGIGEKVTSISNLADETGLTVKQVRLALDKLERTGEVARYGTNKFTVIKVVNYCHYQGSDVSKGQAEGQTKGKQRANGGQTKGKQRATNKNDKNEKNDKNDKNITSASEGFDWSKYSERELTEIYPLNPEYGLTTAEIDKLYAVIEETALERYLLKVQQYKTKDAFATIVRWAKQDMTYKGE